jgi:hypothetical protein
VIDAIEAFGDIDFERILRPKSHCRKDSSDGIMAGPSWAKAIGMGREFSFPCGFQSLAH